MAFREAYGDTLAVSGSATKAARIQFFEDTDDGTHSLVLQAAAMAADLVFTLPNADGSNGHVLKTNGSGVMSWGAVSAGSVAADDIGAGDGAVSIATTSGNITIDAQEDNSDIIFKGTDGGSDITFMTMDGSESSILIPAAQQLQFRDTGLHISSNADGDLDIVSDGTAVDSINIESGGGITLDAGTAASGIIYEDDGTEMLRIYNSSSDVILEAKVADKNFQIKGTDDSSGITALDIDMADAGRAVFNDDVRVGTDCEVLGDLLLGAGANEFSISEASDDITISALIQDKDMIFKVNDGGSATEVLRLDGDVSSVVVAAGKELRTDVLRATGDTAMQFRFPKASMSGAFDIAVADNLASALQIIEGSTSYMKFVTSNSAEEIVLGVKLDVGDNNIENVGDIALDSISADGGASVEFNFPEMVMSGAFEIGIADNVAAALVIAEGANDYMTFKTSNNAESVQVDKPWKAAAAQYQNVTLITPGATAVDYSTNAAVSFVAATPSANATVFLPSVSGSGVAGRTIVFKNLSDTKSLTLKTGDATARIYAGATAIASGSGYVVGTGGASVTVVSGPSSGGWQDWYIF